jgi:type I restriction enzyme S subunit
MTPPGYKQTEVGVIPEEWGVESLDQCVRSDAPICYGILMPGEHHDGGIPVVKVRDIIGGRVDESNLLLTHPSIDQAYKRSRLNTGDLLITIRGTTGRVAIASSALNGANITQDTARLRLRDRVS